jgi:hypothetical protein
MTDSRQWVIIGSAQDRRVQGFQQALELAGCAPATVVDYLSDWQAVLPALLTPDTYLRIESPGSQLPVVRQLMLDGAHAAEASGFSTYSTKQIQDAELEHGEFIAPHQFYYGLRQRLRGLQELLDQYPIAGCLNHIPDILTFFDKQATHQRLAQQGISVPTALYDIQNYADLRERMQQAGLREVFIKTRFGSAASGIIALKTAGEKVLARTTIEVAKGRFFNTRRLQQISNESALASLVDSLCQWGVHCENWLPKARINNMNTDCRLIVVNGKPDFAVLRKSQTPITNLHLLNERANIEELTHALPDDTWPQVLNTARKLAGLFPKSFHFAPDIAVHQDLQSHSVLEINAFGDFIQNIQHQGMNSYSWELHQWMAHQQRLERQPQQLHQPPQLHQPDKQTPQSLHQNSQQQQANPATTSRQQ